MDNKNPVKLYFKSTLNLALATATVLLAGAGFFFFAGFLKLILPLAVVVLYAVVTISILFSRRGATAILETSDKLRVEQLESQLEKYRKIREQISFLRIGSEPVNKAIQYLLQVSGDYLNKCAELKTYSPTANYKLEETLKMCQLFQEERDEASTEKRYQVEDKNDFTDYEARTATAITRAANIIKEQMNNELVELTRKEQMEIIDEMDKENK